MVKGIAVATRGLVLSAIVICCSAAGAMAAPSHARLYAPKGAHLPFSGSPHAVCAPPSPGVGRCLIHVLQPAAQAHPSVTVTSPTGLSPETIDRVYGFTPTSSTAGGQTIAIVDAYNDPNAASDLETFSQQYGLPAANFTQVNQSGGSSLPSTNAGWDLEISLDIEWAHAIAPGAHILLVEASTNSLSNLLTAEQYAASHASYVSNSWGASEFSSESFYDSYFAAAGVSYFAASGDEGGKVIWPSAAPSVTSVGGTSLMFTSGGTLAQEEAWSKGGGGCSAYETASASQKTGSVNCGGKRATPDLSLDANPNSGVSVYDSVTYESQSGWWTVGGTSASTPMTAAESAAHADAISASFLYASPANLPYRDIVLGSNGHPTLTGYDLATGLGSWSYTPGAPTGLTAAQEASGVSLHWNAPTGATPTEYVIWRGASSGQESTQVATVPAAETSYLDSTATGAGPYYYVVQAIDGAGSGPFSGQALASVPPVASFSKSCSEAKCSFASTSTDAIGTISAYAWNGGNGVTGTTSTFSDTYTATGAYTVTLKVTNTAGQSSTASGQVSCNTAIVGNGKHRRTALLCS